MGSTNFDQAKANALIQELGTYVVEAPEYEDYDWQAISLVIDLGDRRRQYGFVYTDDGYVSETPGADAIEIATELQAATKIPDQAAWKKCLIQLFVLNGDIELKIDFDYEGTLWSPNTQDPDGFAMSLRAGQ